MVQNLFSISSFFKIKFMFKHIFYAVLLFISAATSQCSKTTTAVPDDPNALPPETQTGAGTFACKINGVVWKYKDPNYQVLDNRPKTRWNFDSSLRGGNLEIIGFNYYDESNSSGVNQIDLYSDSLITKNEKIINDSGYNYGMKFYNDSSKNCQQFSTTPIYDKSSRFFSSGKLNITKFDQNAKIISGNFSCTIYQIGCDSLKITEGRFDLKY